PTAAGSGALAFVVLAGLGLLGLYVAVRWSLANAAIALEDVGPIQALGRSRALTAGNVRRIFALYVLLGLLTLPLNATVYALGIADADSGLLILFMVVSGLVTSPLLVIASAVVIGDLTARPVRE